MKKLGAIVVILTLACAGSAAAEVTSLSHVFALGKGLTDADGDGLADHINFRIVIPDQPTAEEAAAAADIAGRANLESLAADFGLVVTESQLAKLQPAFGVVLIGSRLGAVKKWLAAEKGLAALSPSQGAVAVIAVPGGKGLAVVAGSGEALLKTARAFFLRWPYFWEIWGRENGSTFDTLEKDLGRFLAGKLSAPPAVTFTRALYEFPPVETPHEALRRLSFTQGEVRELGVDLACANAADADRAWHELGALARDRSWGRRTEVMSYPGAGLITFRVSGGPSPLEAALPRTGYPKRLLTPAYKTPPRPETRGKEFDFLGLYTTKATLGDTDQDGLPDTIETSIIVPRDAAWKSLPDLTTRLVLSSAGGSFPLVYLDKEVENPKSLTAPLLIGDNALTRSLVKTGRLRPQTLGAGQAGAMIVPAAFAKSTAVVLSGADAPALDGLIGYLGRTFPYLAEYGKGNAQLSDVSADVEKFLAGERGAAEGFVYGQLKKIIEELKGKDLESLQANILLPQENPAFLKEARDMVTAALKPRKTEFTEAGTHSGKTIFEKSKEFGWEADEALALLREKVRGLPRVPDAVTIEAGLSESPAVRRALTERFVQAAAELGIKKAQVSVRSAYKQGFFWLLEDVLPRLKALHPARIVIRWAVEKDDFGRMKRFYTEPTRWLQELYPVDELLARDLGLPLERIAFESTETPSPVYHVAASDDSGKTLLEADFSPHLRETPYLQALPEWGTVKVATGWLEVSADGKPVCRESLATDLEKFWTFYQDEVLAPVYATILKKTGNAPVFSKQPFFKKLTVELWASEPDFRLGLDQERVSSLEAMHDELYFDTLDFLRGVTDTDPGEEPADDATRFSAPGNVMPIIHPSSEGEPPRVKVSFEEDRAAAPQLEFRWKEAGHVEMSRTSVFPSFKPKSLSVPALVYDARRGRLVDVTVAAEFDKEETYTQLIDILGSCRELAAKGLTAQAVRFPALDGLTLRLKVNSLEKEEGLPVLSPLPAARPAAAAAPSAPIVPGGILSPEMVWDSVRRLGATGKVLAYSAGTSYEGRAIPVLEVRTPEERYVSTPRLVTFKPTLYLSGRQHANEVSSTSYILKLAERLARDPAYAAYARKVNFILHPVENPDGASLAFDLQKITPEHSLHAGRYSALGLEIGTQTDSAKPILPEAKVRRDINAEWLPDIYLNLHGYPSHEWVQAFSNYSPYLFREYWIPRGWYAYFRAVTNPFWRPWEEAAAALEKTIVSEMQARADIRDSDRMFYDRYARWATRWEPHLDTLEIYDGLDLYVKRTASQEVKPVGRTRTTYVEETPELMDETAQDGWLDFLTEQGLTYLTAHIKYLAAAHFDVLRLEEESGDRVRIQFFRGRPGASAAEPAKK